MSEDAQVHAVDRLADLLLGELSDAETERVLGHVASCAECSAAWDELQATGNHLADDAPRSDPPLAIREHVLAQIAPDAKRRRGRTKRWPPAAAGAVLAVLAGAAAASVLWLTLGANPTPGSQLAALSGPHGMGGRVYMDTSLHRATMQVWSLPKLPQGMVYEVWWNRRGTHTMGGCFGVDRTGTALITLTIPANWRSATSIAITEEPAPGTHQPTGVKLVGGAVSSTESA